ncbi:hypothetical protein BJ546DRAFT_107121 [Cryomyces antarcticus]
MLHPLGTFDRYWRQNTRTISLAAAQYVGVSASAGFTLEESRGRKEALLDSFARFSDCIPSQDLEACHGLLPSMCTGFAQSVPLRVLLAENLEAFKSSDILGSPILDPVFEELKRALQQDDFNRWLSRQAHEHEQRVAIVTALGLILQYMARTGIEKTGPRPANRVLVTKECLGSCNHKCRHEETVLPSLGRLLATAVCHHIHTVDPRKFDANDSYFWP